jgi:STE24 endopeptidase
MNIYLVIIIAALLINYALSTTAAWLNLRNISEQLPDEFQGFYDEERYRKSQQYLRETTIFGLIHDTFHLVVILVFILAGGFNFVDNIARSAGAGTIGTGLMFAGIILLMSQLIDIPFSVWSTFVIEEKFGFNKTTVRTFINDILKGLVLTALIGGLVFAGIIWFFETMGPAAWVYCWVALSIFQIMLMFVAPVLIMPIFNKFEPLEDGELKKSIMDYARKENFKMQGVFKMDGSKRSTKSNAFFTGFGKFKRIVLFDTLIARHTVEELTAIIAHEMGHYKLKHILKGIVRSILMAGFTFWLLSLFIGNQGLFEAFRMEHVSVYASLFFFGFLYAPIGMVTGIFDKAISRKHEFQADEYAVRSYGHPEAMITALKKLSVDNLSNLTPHPFMVFLEYSHPPVLERIKAIRRIAGTDS